MGDALGMPTQLLPRRRVGELFPVLDGFREGPWENEVSRGWEAGRVTDDTEQALVVAEVLLAGGGRVDGRELVRRLLGWARKAEADGTEQLGPSTRRALEAVGRCVPLEEAGRYGDTNGAAMRIASVGVAVPLEPLEGFVDRVEEACRPTHNTGPAIAGAAAVAAAVSAGVGGASFGEAFGAACRAAEVGARRGRYVAGADVARRMAWAVELVRGVDDEGAEDAVYGLVGTGLAAQETVPAAFAVGSRWPEDPWRACLMAARLGGDTDTVGAIAGAVVGACAGVGAFPAGRLEEVERVNGLGLARVAELLVRLRTGSEGGVG